MFVRVRCATALAVMVVFCELSLGGAPDPSGGSGASCDAASIGMTDRLSFRQKTCWYARELYTPKTAIKAALFAGFAQLRNSPEERHDGLSDYGHRFGTRLAQITSKDTAEYLVGALNHEDPRMHASGRTGFWRRTASAFMGGFTARGDDGSTRFAFSHMAGALGAGFSGAGCYGPRRGNELMNGFERSGFAYSTYFTSAVYNEFHPDLIGLASKLLSRKH